MTEENQEISDEIIEENSEDNQEVIEDVTEEAETSEDTETSENEEEAESEVTAESGQSDTSEDDPEWMKKRLKRLRRKLGEEHASETQIMRDELTQLRSQSFSQQPPAQPATSSDVDENDPRAVARAAAREALSEQLEELQQEEWNLTQKKEAAYVDSSRLEMAVELQALADASESDIDPCAMTGGVRKLDESMLDNAIRLSNGADVLRAMCSGNDWKRIMALPKFEQAREMGKYSRKLSSMKAKKTTSNAPTPMGTPRGTSKPSLSKSPNQMTAHDFRVAIREKTL